MFPKIKPTRKTIYLDHAATTYVAPQVLKSMQPFWHEQFGNPSALYKKGREARRAIEESRERIAGFINARPSEIIFTAGGTESVNMALFGVAKKYQPSEGKRYHILSTAIEHHVVLNSLEALKQLGFEPNLIGVDNQGFVKLDELKAAVRPETVLISIMYANNEIGSVQPVVQIGKWLKEENAKRKAQGLPAILLHSDACQAAGSLDLNVQKLGVDLMSVNGSKIYGPKQTGFLYVRTGINLKPIIYGGGQEKDLRSGTENVPGIVGLAKALELVQKERLRENRRISGLRDYLLKVINKKIPDIIINGPGCSKDSKEALRLPNNLNISFSGVEGEALMFYLDSYNICVATGSACTSQDADPSHVLLAIGRSYEEAKSSVRFTPGKQTSKQDIDYVLKVLPGIVSELRRVKNG